MFADQAQLAERLLFGSRLRVASTEDAPLGAWEPSKPARAAHEHLRGLEHQPPEQAAARLAWTAARLLETARIAWWPIQMQGELDVSADEKPAVVVTEMGIEDEWLRQPVRECVRQLRQGTSELISNAVKLETADLAGVSLGRVETVALPAVDLAVWAALLAVHRHPGVAASRGAGGLGR